MSYHELASFFRERIDEAADNQKVYLSPMARSYLLGVLIDTSKIENVISSENLYLFDLYQKACNSFSTRDAFNTCKLLGDHTLVISGYFPQSLERKIVNANYYSAMGKTGYEMAASLCDVPELFMELSDNYGGCVHIFNEVSECSVRHNASDIGRLYDLWLKTDSPGFKSKLRKIGMVIDKFESWEA